jgi:PAS domain S-box-containing protein
MNTTREKYKNNSRFRIPGVLLFLGITSFITLYYLAKTSKIPALDKWETLKIGGVDSAFVLLLMLTLILIPGLIAFSVWQNTRKKFYLQLLQSEQEKKTLKQHYDSILKYANDIIILCDTNLKILEVNDRAMEVYGYSREEMGQMSLSRLVAPENIELFNTRINKLLAKGSWQSEALHIKADGSRFNAEVSGCLVIIEDKEFILEIIRDVSQRKRMEEKLIASINKANEGNILKSNILQNISHEVRTPMNAIMGFSELLEKNLEEGQDAAKALYYATIIRKRSEDLIGIFNDLLNLSILESQTSVVNLDKVNISTLMHDIFTKFSVFREKANKTHVNFLLANIMDIEPRYFYTDKIKLAQILNSLLQNAFKFTDVGQIEFGFREELDNKLLFFVTDTGIGIDSEKQNFIFDSFQKADETGGIYGGLGLGLSIAKGNAKLLGGDIWLESEKDRGTNFYFTISAQETTADKEKHDDSIISKNLSVLIVEDDYNSSELLQAIVAQMGIKAKIVNTGEKAIEFIRENPTTQLILMDIGLPGMNGFETTRAIKSISKEIKVIAQSAFVSSDEKNIAFDAGCDDFISKPINPKLLLSKIAEIC